MMQLPICIQLQHHLFDRVSSGLGVSRAQAAWSGKGNGAERNAVATEKPPKSRPFGGARRVCEFQGVALPFKGN